MEKPKFVFHISDKIPENETTLKPRKNFDINREEEIHCVFTSFPLGYVPCFFNDFVVFRARETDVDGTQIIFVVTKNLEKLRKKMKNFSPKVYKLSSQTFSQKFRKDGWPTNEWVSKEEVEILDRNEITYEEILNHNQVFYLETQEAFYSEEYKKLIVDRKRIKEILIHLVNRGTIVYENKVEQINDDWLFSNQKNFKN